VLKAERAAYILQRLQELYPQTPVPLDHTDPFTLLVAVLLSAQCTDERVNQVTPALFALADTPAAMAALDVEQIREPPPEFPLASPYPGIGRHLSGPNICAHTQTSSPGRQCWWIVPQGPTTITFISHKSL